MSLLSSVAENVTGNLDKAYIVFSKPYPDNYKELNADTSNSNINAWAEVVYKKATSLTRNVDASGKLDEETVLNKFGKWGYQVIKVQYNPSNIRISSSNGRRIRPNAVAGGNEMGLQESNLPFRTTLSMELFFDDTDNSDAFSSLDGGVWSQTGMLKNGISAGLNYLKTGSTVRGHTVQDISELFISAAVNPLYRLIIVVWNTMVFAGQIHSVDLEYLMFNSVGNPIRSKVRLEVMATDRRGDDEEHNADWEAIYEKMFPASKTLASSETLTGSASVLSDLFNLK